MKKIILRITNFLSYLKNYSKLKKYHQINETLEQTLRKREVDRVILKGQIIKMVKGYLRIDANSKYIPKERRNDTEIKERVIAEFGNSMSELGIKINDQLELI